MDSQIDSRPESGCPASSIASGGAAGPWLQLFVPHEFEWNCHEIPLASLAPELEGFRIVQVSDLHFRKVWSPVYDQVIERVRQAKADLIVITGDLNAYKHDNRPALPFIRRFVSQLRARFGSFAICGNHDQYSLAERLDGCGVTYLDGRQQLLDVNGAKLELLGIPGVYRKNVTRELLASFPPKQTGTPRLVLSHFPDLIRKAKSLNPDIYFAGHTHGGQICLPGGYPIIRHDALPRRLCRGVHKAFGTWLVVSRGLGFTGLPIRLFCPAEVVEIKLVRDSAEV